MVYLVDRHFELAAALVNFFIQRPKALVSLVVLIRDTIENSTEHADVIDIHLICITVRGVILNQSLLTQNEK
ncbi:hypothetical protein CF124_21725 [Aeromonas hydrophila]|nr:hypothetical protein A9R12_10185 [Aeromonas hydrophila]TNI62387.1 hypothetical protein CF124_21725 [Aeromonas hydrophila]